ncbi:condensation domain-containing protein, partial [Nocardia sp. NPDC004722]
MGAAFGDSGACDGEFSGVGAGKGADLPATLAELPGGGVGDLPLLPVARWMVEWGSGFDRFDQHVALRLPHAVAASELAAAVSAVLDRHDMLRSRLRVTETGEWALEITEPGTVRGADVVTRRVIDTATGRWPVADIAAAELNSALDRLDPRGGTMIRFTLLEPADGTPGWLLIVAHHLVIDGVSWRVLVPDLLAALEQVRQGGTPALEPGGTSMRRWAHGLVTAAREPERIAELGLWQSMIAGTDPLWGGRDLDPAIDTAATLEQVGVELPEAVTRALLTRLPAAFHAGVNDGLLAGLTVAVRIWRARRGLDDPSVLVRLEGHGREEQVVPGADLSRTVGWFTSMFPVRFDLGGHDLDAVARGEHAVADAVFAIKETLRSIPDKGIGYGLLRYLNAETAAALPDRMPGRIGFNYLGRVGTEAAGGIDGGLGELAVAADPDVPVTVAVDVSALVVDDRLRATLRFPRTLLARTDVEELAQLWTEALTALVAHVDTEGAGGHSPSDFDLVALRQADIADLERAYPDLTDVWPVTSLQAGLLFHARLAASSASTDVYAAQVILRLSGELDPERLRAALAAVAANNDGLRTAYPTTRDGISLAVVRERVEIPWQVIDLSDRPDAEAELAELAATEKARRFDLAAAPLLRCTLIRLDADRWAVVLTDHHVILDGWSWPLLVTELFTRYATGMDPGVAGGSYRDFLAWLAARDTVAARAAWSTALAGAEPTLLAQPAATAAVTVAERSLVIDAADTRELVAAAAAAGVTLNTVLQSAWALLMAQSTGHSDIVFGTTVSGRPTELATAARTLGLFINTVPARVRLDPAETVSALWTRLHLEQAALLDHHHLGLTEIQELTGGDALFDTAMVLESYPVDARDLARVTDTGGLTLTGASGDDSTHYPLSCTVIHQDTLRIRLQYRPELLADAAVAALAERLPVVLRGLARGCGLPVREVAVLSAAERTALLRDWGRSVY